MAAERQGLSSDKIDQLVDKAMETFNIPGLAIGITQHGKVIHAKGYGVTDLDNPSKVDTQTLFSIASTGKGFTAAGLALLVDQGKITWKTKVTDILPEFQLYDPWVTREFTVKDLIINNSGLGLGAGDLMMFPSQGFSRQEIITNLRYLKPVSSFRSEFAYDNILYVVAGEVIAAVSGKSYENFIDQQIFAPLDMKHCGANLVNLQGHKNVANPHMEVEGKLQTTTQDVAHGKSVVFAAAGGLQCSVESLLKWLDMHLSNGKLPNGDVFLSQAQHAQLISPQTILPVKSLQKEWFNTSFSAYGLGWKLADFHGVKMVQHGGGLLGNLRSA